MEAFVSFVLSIVAGLIINYLSKWLDRVTTKSDQHSNKKDRD